MTFMSMKQIMIMRIISNIKRAAIICIGRDGINFFCFHLISVYSAIRLLLRNAKRVYEMKIISVLFRKRFHYFFMHCFPLLSLMITRGDCNKKMVWKSLPMLFHIRSRKLIYESAFE